jgi:muramidase (phage lysozyme)
MPAANFLARMGVSAAESIMGMMGGDSSEQSQGSSSASDVGNVATGRASTQKIIDLISRYESNGGNYNILFGGGEANITSMTVGELLEYQRKIVNAGAKGSAAGKYQIVPKTLQDLLDKNVVSRDEKFSPAVQDRLGLYLLKRRGLDEFQAGKLPIEQFADNLSKEFAAFPYNTGKSYYDKDGLNRAGLSRQEFIQSLGSAKFGGVISGPESGYQATLHGTEAVIPLAGGRTLPMEMPGLADSFRSQMTLMSAQIEKLDELIDVVRNGNAINRNMLKAARA